jgi:hypothetical protein
MPRRLERDVWRHVAHLLISNTLQQPSYSPTMQNI